MSNFDIKEIQDKLDLDFKSFDKGNAPQDVLFNYKGESTENKIELFKLLLTHGAVLNSSMLSNLWFLIRSGADLSDDFFKLDAVWFNDLEEFLDIKIELKKEIDIFTRELVKYYLAVMASASYEMEGSDEGAEGIPYTFQRVLLSTDLFSLSNLVYKVDLNTKDLPIVSGSVKILSALVGKAKFIMSFAEDVLNKSVEVDR